MKRMVAPIVWAVFTTAAFPASAPKLELFEWERGFGLRVPGAPAADMFLWVYEWNMFEAMQRGQHIGGTVTLVRVTNRGSGFTTAPRSRLGAAARPSPRRPTSKTITISARLSVDAP